jgi:hypothetical protein
MVTGLRRVLTQPLFQLAQAEIPGLIEVEKKSASVRVGKVQPVSVNAREGSRHRDSDPLVAIDKRMILRETFPQRRCLLDQVLGNLA